MKPCTQLLKRTHERLMIDELDECTKFVSLLLMSISSVDWMSFELDDE